MYTLSFALFSYFIWTQRTTFLQPLPYSTRATSPKTVLTLMRTDSQFLRILYLPDNLFPDKYRVLFKVRVNKPSLSKRDPQLHHRLSNLTVHCFCICQNIVRYRNIGK